MSYIKKEPLCAWLSNMCVSENIIKTIESDIRFPPADVVEVVRCKDCVHYESYHKPVEDFDGKCFARCCETDDQDFCNYGKRKTN